MLRFFSNIRYRLASQNKVAAYLRYATGEILLVVIGILIALQVNNWNQKRNDLKEGILIKQNIYEEFIQNREQLIVSRDLSVGALNAGKLLMGLIGADQFELDHYNLDSLFNQSLMAETYLPTSNSLQDIMQSGRMNLLRDTELKNTILSWKASLDLFLEYKQVQTDWQNNQYLPYMLPVISFKQMDIYNQKIWSGKTKLTTNYYPLFHDLKFENMVDNNLYLIEFLLVQLNKIEKYQEKIIELTKLK